MRPEKATDGGADVKLDPKAALPSCPFCGGTEQDGTLIRAHGDKYVRHSRRDDCPLPHDALLPASTWRLRTSPAAGEVEGEPVAWMFELANARNTETDEPCNWGEPKLSFTPPGAGKYQRNVEPLYPASAIESLQRERDEARAANYRTFTDGMVAAAEICGSLAETTYDDTDGFEAATGCEAAIMRVVRDQRKEQSLSARGHKWAPIMDGTVLCQYCMIEPSTATSPIREKAPLRPAAEPVAGQGEALRIAEERLSSLLARIHRDGGHYEAAHGTEKAWADADEIIARLYADTTHPAHAPAALRPAPGVVELPDLLEFARQVESHFQHKHSRSGGDDPARTMARQIVNTLGSEQDKMQWGGGNG